MVLKNYESIAREVGEIVERTLAEQRTGASELVTSPWDRSNEQKEALGKLYNAHHDAVDAGDEQRRTEIEDEIRERWERFKATGAGGDRNPEWLLRIEEALVITTLDPDRMADALALEIESLQYAVEPWQRASSAGNASESCRCIGGREDEAIEYALEAVRAQPNAAMLSYLLLALLAKGDARSDNVARDLIKRFITDEELATPNSVFATYLRSYQEFRRAAERIPELATAFEILDA